jgi:hypothetical protein
MFFEFLTLRGRWAISANGNASRDITACDRSIGDGDMGLHRDIGARGRGCARRNLYLLLPLKWHNGVADLAR